MTARRVLLAALGCALAVRTRAFSAPSLARIHGGEGRRHLALGFQGSPLGVGSRGRAGSLARKDIVRTTRPVEVSALDASGWAAGAREAVAERNAYRVATVAAIGVALATLPLLDSGVAALWEVLRTKAWFRHDMFEPFVAVGSFFAWLHGWLIVDKLATSGAFGGRFNYLRRYRLQDQQAVAKGAPGLAEGKLPKPTRWYAGWPWELFVYLAPLYFLSQAGAFMPRRMALEWAAPSFLTVCGQVLGGLFLYDFFFWFGHLAMHRAPRRLYKALHGKHHQNPEVRASDTVRLTVVEEVVDVVCSIAALRLLQAHPLSRMIYNIVITFMLVELHCGYNMPWSPQNLLPAVFAGSKRHHAHHRTGGQYYGKFFKWMDDLYNRATRPAHRGS